MSLTSQNKKAGRIALKLALIIPVMQAMTQDESRWINVEFIANVYEGAPMAFAAPEPSKLKAHPGELVNVSYQAQNLAKEDILA